MSDSTSISFPVNPDDQRPLPEIIADLAGFPLAYHDLEDGTRVYAVQDWIAGIAQSDDPRKFWNTMKRRFTKMGIELSSSWRQLPYRAINGKTYKMDHADAQTLYQITQRMDTNTGIRDKVLKYLAQAGVIIDEMRIDPEIALQAVIAYYRRMGKSDSWINTRIRSTIVRNGFTFAFKQAQRYAPGQHHYMTVTNTMRAALWKRDTNTIRKQLGIGKNENVRDHLPEIGLTYEMLSEQASAMTLETKRNLSFDAANEIVRDNSELIGKHASELGQKLGIDLLTNKPQLPKGQ